MARKDSPSHDRVGHGQLDQQASLLRAMLALPMPDAAGCALSYLLQLSVTRPDVLRRLLNEPVVKEGFRGVSMLTVLTRAATE